MTTTSSWIRLFILIGLMMVLFAALVRLLARSRRRVRSSREADQRLRELHAQLRLKYGTFEDEFPEQMMAARYIQPNDRVLELGGNIGRNSLIIASLLHDPRQLVTLESDPNIARQLDENRQENRLPFHIVCAALSAQPLIQSGWNTMPYPPGEPIPEGFQPVATVDLQTCQQLVVHPFTTLVADCEGALFYILRDFPEMLTGMQTVILENDYTDRSHKDAVDERLRQYGFECDYREAGGWGPCTDCFFEVWVKK